MKSFVLSCIGLVAGVTTAWFFSGTGKLDEFDTYLGHAINLLDEAATYLPRGSAIEQEITTFIEMARQSRAGS